MRKLIIPAVLVLALTGMFAGAAMADDIHLCPVITGCSATSVIPISGTTAYISGNIATGSELYVAILVPVADTSGTWNSNSTQLWTLLSESPSQVFPNLNSAISQLSGATGITAQSFNVSDFLLGTWGGTSPQQITLPNEPVGTLFVGFSEFDGALTLVTPWSSSLVNVPEPSSLMFLGVGLLGVLAIAGTKLVKA